MPLSRHVLQRLAEARIAEAEVLLAAGHDAGAYYLAGYAVEFALKATVARQFRADEIPDWALTREFKTHRFERLIEFAGLQTCLATRRTESRAFDQSWIAVSEWTEQVRYEQVSQALAGTLVTSIAGTDRVLAWIRTHW